MTIADGLWISVSEVRNQLEATRRESTRSDKKGINSKRRQRGIEIDDELENQIERIHWGSH